MSQEEIIEQLQVEIAQLREEKAQEEAKKAQAQAEKAQAEAEILGLREVIEELSKRLYEKMQDAAELVIEKQRLQGEVEELSSQVHDLLGRVAKDSRTSSKPPSTDGYAKKTRSLRQPTGKKQGGQAGHIGYTRNLVETPDEVIPLRPEKCTRCQTSLEGVRALGYERRQRVDLPDIKAQVIEYQAQDVPCPHCQHVSRGTFPDEIRASVQFGPTIKGIALNLLYGQFLPYVRTAELLSDLCGCHLSPGTLEAFVVEGAERLFETEEQIKQARLRSRSIRSR
jgi:transposase